MSALETFQQKRWIISLILYTTVLMLFSSVCYAQGGEPEDVSADVTVTTANERSYLDRRTRIITSTADVTITNTSDKTISSPLHAVINISNDRVQMPEALGGPGTDPYDKYYYDLSGSLSDGELSPGDSITFGVKFVRSGTVRFQYNVITHGVLPSEPENQCPVANSGGPYTGLTHQNITFDGSGSSDPDEDPLMYEWDFGDGTTGSGAQVSHAYNLAGTYTVRLTVSDGRGGVAEDTAEVIVVESDQPKDIDLTPYRIDLSGISTDAQCLKTSGTVNVTIVNNGQDPVSEPFELLLFEDRENNCDFDPGNDNILARTTIYQSMPASSTLDVPLDIMGELLFRGNLLYAFVDSTDQIRESDETNNISSSQPEGVDLTGSCIRIDTNGCPDSVTLTARLGNAGNIQVGPGVKMAFYVADINGNLQWIATGLTTKSLTPGQHEDITIVWEDPVKGTKNIYAQADDTGGSSGVYQELDETNNMVAAVLELCVTIPAVGENSISGRASDAVTGEPLPGAVVNLKILDQGVPAEAIAQVETNTDGYYLFEGIDEGAYIIEAEHPGFIPGSRQTILYAGQGLTDQDIVLSPKLANGQIRIVLTWGKTPADLEAHLTGPNPEGCRYHCFFWDKTFPGAQLDRDDRDGYGPETITITQTDAGTYRYYVHDWTNRHYNKSTGLSLSGAEVRVYTSNTGNPVIFTMPSGPGTVWHVFDLDGQTGQIKAVNRMTSQDHPGEIDFPVITSQPVTTACVGVPCTYHVEAIDPDNDTLSYTLEKFPDGMTIDPNTGVITWTPMEDPKTSDYGEYKVQARVFDGRCGTDMQTFKIKVSSIMITIYPEIIYPGQSCTLSWVCDNAYSGSIDQGIGQVDARGSLEVSPADDTTYTITGVGPAGTVTASTTVVVEPSVEISSPGVCDWTPGDGITLTWSAKGTEACFIDQGIGQVEPEGSMEVFPTEPTTYTLTAHSPSGIKTASIHVPNYHSVKIRLGASSTHILPGESTTLSWETTCANKIDRLESYDETGISLIGELDGNGSITVSPTQDTLYTLKAYCSGEICGMAEVRVFTSPLVSLSASPRTFYPGQPVTLTWTSVNADTCIIEPGIGEVPLNGNLDVSPAKTTTYAITATGSGGTSTSLVTIFHVKPAIQISADPSILKTNTTTTLTWTTQYADSCSIDQGIGEVPLNGSIEVHPSKTTKYTLTATGPGGMTKSSATVFYVEPTVSITADPQVIVRGESTTLSWTSGLADYCEINNNIGRVDANGSIGVSPTAPTTYTITAYGPGGTATDDVTVSFLEVSLGAFPANVSSGQKSTLSWTSVNADVCIIEPGIGAVPSNGSIDVYPTETTTYTITAHGFDRATSDTATVALRIADDIDIRPVQMEMDTSIDSQALAISGNVSVGLARSGQEGVLEPFQVVVFEDRDCNGIYDPAKDNILGSEVSAPCGGSSTPDTVCSDIDIPVTGTLLFRDNRIYAFVDAHDVLNETDEANNIIHSGMFGFDTVDLTGSFIRVDNTQCPAAAVLTVRIGNGGSLTAIAGVKTTFYDGSPEAGGHPIGTVSTTKELAPGEYQDISLTWNAPTPGLHAIYIRADDDGTGAGTYAETDKVNNLVKAYLSICSPEVGDNPGWISGQVLDAQAGTPLEGAVVFLREIQSGFAGIVIDMTTSGADGSYLFESIAPDSYVLEASLIGYRIKTLPIILCSGDPLSGQDIGLLPHLSVTIMSPADESYVGVSPITVTGTVGYDADSVMVNGVSAVVTGNTFTAEGIELSEGENTITAVAWDADGNMTEKTVYVTFDPTPLAVQITEPLDGSTAAGASVTVRFSASDPSAKVTVNGIPSDPWDDAVYNVPIAEGANTITATATDQCGRTATQTITVYGGADLPPTITIVQPCEQNIYSSSVAVSGTIADDSATVVVNGVTAVVSDKTFTAEIPLAEGENIITSVVTDKGGNTATDSITVNYHTGPPTCTILYPEEDFVEYNSRCYVNVCSTLSTIVVNGETVEADYYDGYYYTWVEVELADGPNVITATASDSYGNTAQASITGFYAGDDWPWISITSPRWGDTISTDRIDVTGTVNGTSVFVTVNGIKATVENGTFIAEGIELVDGYNYITATVTGPYNAVETDTVRVKYDDPPPVVTIESPQDGSELPTSPIKVTGTIDDNNATVTVNGVSAVVENNTFIAENIYLTRGLNLITVKARDKKGNTSTTSITVTCTKAVHITITDPAGGATINRAEVMVEGTYESEPQGVVIMVNNSAAVLLDDGRFIANAIPVQLGENTITATITDSNGNTDAFSITVYANEIIEDVRLTSNIESGVPPLAITFTVDYSYNNYIDSMIVQAEMDFEGDGVIDLNPTSPTFTHTYETPGVFYPTITLTDELGNTYTASTAIVVYDRNTVDALLKSKWNGMKQALINGDIDGALEYFHPASRKKYGKIYSLCSSYLSEVGAALGDIHMVWVHDDMALYYTISNEDGDEYIYDVLFSRDESGTWRIEEY